MLYILLKPGGSYYACVRETRYRSNVYFWRHLLRLRSSRGSVNLWAKTTGISLKRKLVPYSTFSGDRFSLLDQLDSWLSSAWKMLFYAFFGLKVPQKCFFWYTKWFFELVPKRRQFLSKRPQRFVAFKCLKNVILVFTQRFTEQVLKHRTDGH